MKWFRRRRSDVHIIKVPLSGLIRQVIYDSMVSQPILIAQALGLPPISEEVEEMEQRASAQRISEFEGLLDFIDAHAEISGRIATTTFYLARPDVDVEELPELTQMFKVLAFSSAVSCISTLFSLGLIDTTKETV